MLMENNLNITKRKNQSNLNDFVDNQDLIIFNVFDILNLFDIPKDNIIKLLDKNIIKQ
jgi:hypothetical protein